MIAYNILKFIYFNISDKKERFSAPYTSFKILHILYIQYYIPIKVVKQIYDNQWRPSNFLSTNFTINKKIYIKNRYKK